MSDISHHDRRKGKVQTFFHELAINWRVYLLGLCASFGGLLFGYDTVIGGVLTTKSFQDAFGFTTKQDAKALADLKGNIVSSLQAGCFVGAAMGLFVPDRIGRKPTILIAGFIFLLGSIIQTICRLGSQSTGGALAQLYAGRVIGGLGVGLSSAVVPSYISECTPRAIRGRVTGMYQLLNVSGVAISFWVNYGLSVSGRNPLDPAIWRIPFALQCLPGVILMITMIWQPESPRFLVEHRNDPEKAALVLSRLFRKPVSSPEVQDTLNDMQEDAERTHLMMREKGISGISGKFKAAFATDKKTTYRVCCGIILMIFQQMTATNSINYYTPTIFSSLGINGSSTSLLATGVYGIVKITTTAIFLLFALEQLGRKWCLIIGGLGQAATLYWIGIFQAVRPNGNPVDGWSYATITMIYIYVTFYGLGWSSVAWAVSSEVSSQHLRSFTMALASMTQWCFNCIIARVTPNMLLELKYGTFIFFGSMTVLACIWAAVFLPETSAWPLERLDYAFKGNIVKRSIEDLSIKKRNRYREQVLADLAHTDVSSEEDIKV
ncbi:unnamed protein product [Sympodiomycopsis kandeliae]